MSQQAPLLYIVVRRTTDWKDETVFRRQLPADFVPLVELWNDTFDMPFHLFRHELKRIAELNHSRVEGAATVALEDVPEGALIVPTDDDDWFSPQLATLLHESRSASCLGYRWPSRFLEVPINLRHRLGLLWQALFSKTPPRWSCTTNNHAIVNHVDTAPLIGSHIKASHWFDEHATLVMRLSAPLSVQNRNLGSQTSLLYRKGRMSRSTLLRKYRQYQSLYASPPEPALNWCRPYMARMGELMNELRLRHP